MFKRNNVKVPGRGTEVLMFGYGCNRPTAGHLPHLSAPGVVVRAMEDFLTV
jgi:hypothetical protein